MSTTAVTSLIDALRQHRLVDSKQLDELSGLQFPDPRALAISHERNPVLNSFN